MRSGWLLAATWLKIQVLARLRSRKNVYYFTTWPQLIGSIIGLFRSLTFQIHLRMLSLFFVMHS